MAADTVFDLASLTKVVATTTVTLALLGGELDSPAARYLPAVTAPVTLRQLLTHTSGVPASVTFYQWCRDREQLLAELYATPLERPPGEAVVYSDLGFMLLGEIAAVVAGEPLDRVFADLVAGPLGMRDAGYNPLGGTPPIKPPPPVIVGSRFAATEVYDGLPWTGYVHDENARVLGGVAGHAGLFATAADLARFAQWWVSDSDGPVSAELRRVATTCQTLSLDGRRGFGWTCPGDRYDILGGHWPATSVSHTGFTGTSLALDPVSGRWVVLLTNAVHSGRDATAVKSLRRNVHAALAPSAWPS
jgi:CubicO group peptidase (beta-lactamase class C family)